KRHKPLRLVSDDIEPPQRNPRGRLGQESALATARVASDQRDRRSAYVRRGKFDDGIQLAVPADERSSHFRKSTRGVPRSTLPAPSVGSSAPPTASGAGS